MRDPRVYDLPFDVTDVEHETGCIPLPNGTLLHVPKATGAEEFAAACARAAVDARHEWARPR